MTHHSEPADSSKEPRTIADLRGIRELSLADPASKRALAPAPSAPAESRKSVPLPGNAEARPPAPKLRTAPASAPGAESRSGVRPPITDEEYRKIRARLREDFIVLPRRSVRHWGALVGGILLAIALVGFVTARHAGRAAALAFMQSQLGDMVKRNSEDLDLETREALARSREATEAALDAHGQIELLLDSLRKELGAVESFSTRLTKVEKALQSPAK